MRVLLVEDNTDFAQEVERAASAIGCEVVWERSRDSAVARIDAGDYFDLVILDRRLPTADDVLDDRAEHGWSVFQAVRERSAGTPVWFLTGTPDPDFGTEISNSYARQEDLNGRGTREAMYRVFWKRNIAECMRRLRAFADERAALERIEVVPDTTTLQLERSELQSIRLFGRRHNGVSVAIRSLNGGLSSSRVLHVVVKAADGAPLMVAAAKVSSLVDSAGEAERYRADVSRLRVGRFPHLTERIEAGAGNTGALFYGMVGDAVESLFDRVVSRHADLPHVPSRLHETMQPWYNAKRAHRVEVGQIRRRFVGDTVLPRLREQLVDIDIRAVERLHVEVAQCCQHGDLHCANVVFDGRGHEMLIDFGDTGSSYACADAVTLELSTVFHSQRERLPAGWPTEDDMAHWADVDRFAQNCQFGSFVAGCRSWARAEAGSPEEIVAVAYAYAMRQLKYRDTDKALARALIRSCIQWLTAARSQA